MKTDASCPRAQKSEIEKGNYDRNGIDEAIRRQ